MPTRELERGALRELSNAPSREGKGSSEVEEV
jgi:hypothetical protein